MWLLPCHGPGVRGIGAHARTRTRLVTVSTEEAPTLATDLAISSIPTLAMFRDGREVARQAGAIPAGRIIAWAEASLSA